MPDVRVIAANLEDPSHATAIVTCIDAYARDPMGGGHGLGEDVRDRLIDGLRGTRGSRVWLAIDAPSGDASSDEGDGGGATFLGVVVAFEGYSTFAAAPRWNVHDVAVMPEARDRGVGRAMLKRVIEDARAAGCVAVTLEVRRDNPRARHLYASLGFGDGFAPMDFWERRLDGDSPAAG